MTTDNERAQGDTRPPVGPEALLASRDRIAHQRARTARSLERGRTRRRVLPQILAMTAVVVTLGAADRFVQGAVASTASASSTTTTAGSSATAQALAAVSRTLAADQRALVALARAQSRLATSAGGDGGGATAGSAPGIQLPALASVPNVVVPAVAPTVAATTGASVVVP